MRIFLFLAALSLIAAERTVDPTFLHRYVPEVRQQPSDWTTATCHYKPVFGVGDGQSSVPRGVARFGEIAIDLGGRCKTASYALEEQALVILEGRGVFTGESGNIPLRKNDFLYVPQGMKHTLASAPGAPLRAIVMGFKIPGGLRAAPIAKPLAANIDDVKWQKVSGHPDSVLYQLLIGDAKSKRDKIAAGQVLTSLFIMEFAPGGTNFPHHHEQEEEIYLVLDGAGDMVAGGGADGVEGRHPARAGDAYFFRLNCTVGFYSASEPGSKARILAVRSHFPFSNVTD